jgi:hypothetical protein
LDEGFSKWHAAGAPVNDGGIAAWQFAPEPSYSEGHYFSGALTPTQYASAQTNGWHSEGRLRLASPTASSVGAFMNVTFADRRYDINLFVGSNGSLNVRANTSVTTVDGVTTLAGDSVVIPGSSTAYHLYRMSYDPTVGSATLYVDNVAVIWGYTGHTDYLFYPGLWLGAVGQSVNLNMARLSVDTPYPPQEMPEPISAALACFGLGAIAIFSRRRAR